MNRTILILEDEVIVAENIKRILEQYGYKNIAVANSFEEAVEVVNSKELSFALLDINLGKHSKSGIEVAELINNTQKCPFLFLTANSDKETIKEAKKFTPQGYVIKPFTKEAIYAAIEVNLMQERKAITIKSKTGNYLVDVADINYISADGMYSEIYTDKKHVQRTTLKELLEILPGNFMQIHRSHIVNINHITLYSQSTISLGEVILPVGRAYKDQLKNIGF